MSGEPEILTPLEAHASLTGRVRDLEADVVELAPERELDDMRADLLALRSNREGLINGVLFGAYVVVLLACLFPEHAQRAVAFLSKARVGFKIPDGTGVLGA